MEKIKQYISKHEYFFMFLFIFTSIFCVSLCVALVNGDELWNFQNTYKIYNGYTIYNDANVIVTPLFFIIGDFLFKILGANFFVFRIYNAIIFTFYYFMTYAILRKLKVNKKISITFTLILMVIFNYGLVRIMANYNPLAIAFCMLGIYLMLCKKDYFSNKNIVIQALITFVVILTKQNIGLFYYLALITVILITEKDKRLLKILKLTGILAILGIIFLYILKINNNLEGFFNYAVLGIGQFAQNNISLILRNTVLMLIILVLNLVVVRILVKNKKARIEQEDRRNLLVLQSFSAYLLLVALPIVNEAHFIMAIHLSLILLVNICNIIITKNEINIEKYNIIGKIAKVFILVNIIIPTMSIINWANVIKTKDYQYKYEEPFWGSIISNKLYNNIENVTKYIENKQQEDIEIIVFSSKAGLYQVPLKRSNGYMDMPFYGNTGTLTEEEIEKDISNRKNTEILLEKDEENLEWQEMENLVKRLKQKFTKIGEIEEFEIYLIE